MKKFISLETIVAFIYTTLCYIALIFVPDMIKDPVMQVQSVIIFVTNIYLGLLVLQAKFMDVKQNNQNQYNRDSLLELVAVLKQTNALQEDLSLKIAQLSLNVYTTGCAVERIEKQTKPKTPTTRKKKEA